MKEKDARNIQSPQPLTEEEINSPEFDPEEFAPAPGQSAAVHVPGHDRKNTLFLVILCVACALILAITHMLTVFAAEKGAKDIRRDAVLTFFPGCDRAELYDTVEECPVYVAYYKGKLAGYAVYVTEEGYLGPVEILVALDADNQVCGVKIISHKESEGLGSKIEKNAFLSQFVGLPESDAEPDLISGATASSRAVYNGVERVLELKLDFLAIAADLDVETISSEEMEEEIQKEEESGTDTTAGETTEAPVTTRPNDDTVFGGDNVGGPNSNTGDGDNVSAEGEDDTTVYETETEEPEETTEETTAQTEPVTDTVPVTTAPPQTTAPPDTTEPPETEKPEESTVPEETTGPAEETTSPEAETTGGVEWPDWNR